MANPSLAATPLSCNDIRCLAHLFKASFEYYCHHSALLNDKCLHDYWQDIRTVVGLGSAAALVNGDLLSDYQKLLNTFLRYQRFKDYPAQCARLAFSIANMVNFGSDCFRELYHPRYYEDFRCALKRSIDHIVEDIGIKPPDGAERVLGLVQGAL